jgi:glycosyltransferase involved in cell wall biosynthesis
LRPLCVELLPDTHAAGAENQARYLTTELDRGDDFDVELAYFDPGRGHVGFERAGFHMRRIPRRHRFRFDLFARTRRIRREYGARPPAVLHTWLAEANIFGLLAARAWPETAVVISQRGSWNEWDYPLHMRLQRLFIGRADHAISNSEGGAEMLAELGMPPERISVIPNGVPIDRVEVRERRDELRRRLRWDGRPVIAWVGRAEDPPAMRQKDFGTLLAAVERLRDRSPDAILALVGVTAEDVVASGFALPDWAAPLGWTDRAPDYLNAADALVLSSRTEGHSNVAAEALLLGLPVASTDCGGHCAAVMAAGGRVTPVGDADALAEGLGELLASPPERDAVRATAAEFLSVERMADRTLEVYRRALARRGRPGI